MKPNTNYHVQSTLSSGTANAVMHNSIFQNRFKIMSDLFVLANFTKGEFYHYEIYKCSKCNEYHFSINKH